MVRGQSGDLLGRGTFKQITEGYPIESELIDVRDQLVRIEQELLNSTVPPKEKRSLWIGRIITDGWWNFKDPLIDRLLEIADAYKRKLP